MSIAILVATVSWFLIAGILFFNPVVSKLYAVGQDHASVKVLPPSPKTIGKILFAIIVQVILWAFVYKWINSSLPGDVIKNALIFGTIISFVKMIPRDIDRTLLTTYPFRRMSIEFVIGIICAYVVGFSFAYFM